MSPELTAKQEHDAWWDRTHPPLEQTCEVCGKLMHSGMTECYRHFKITLVDQRDEPVRTIRACGPVCARKALTQVRAPEETPCT